MGFSNITLIFRAFGLASEFRHEGNHSKEIPHFASQTNTHALTPRKNRGNDLPIKASLNYFNLFQYVCRSKTICLISHRCPRLEIDYFKHYCSRTIISTVIILEDFGCLPWAHDSSKWVLNDIFPAVVIWFSRANIGWVYLW